MILNNPQSNFQIFTFSECRDDLTNLFTSQPIVVFALSTASVCRPIAPSAEAPTLCPPAPRPPAPLQLPVVPVTYCMSGSQQAGAWPGLPAARPCPTPLSLGSWPPLCTTCPWGSAAPPGAAEKSIVSFQIQYSGSSGELC